MPSKDLGPVALLGVFAGWEAALGVAGVKASLYPFPGPASVGDEDEEVEVVEDGEVSRVGASWAHHRLPALGGSDAVTEGVVSRFAFGERWVIVSWWDIVRRGREYVCVHVVLYPRQHQRRVGETVWHAGEGGCRLPT